jgi:ABC-type Fe3+ transport system permease subunit
MSHVVLKLACETVAMILLLILVAWMVEKAGERMGVFLNRKARLTVLIGGTVLAIAFNSELLFDCSVVNAVSQIDFAFLIAFLPFCFGMWVKRGAWISRRKPQQDRRGNTTATIPGSTGF